MSQSLKRLVIDTATNYLYLALYEDNKKLESIYQLGHQDHSITLMIELQKLLTHQKVSPKDLDEIYIGVGPGSYTGIRIGVVVAKMLGWSLKKAVFTVSSLALMASSVQSDGVIMPFIDARRGYVFTGLYEHNNGKLKQCIKDAYTHFESFKASNDYQCLIDKGEADMTKLFNTDLVSKVDNIHQLSPVYLRETEAERQLKDSLRR
ncbi:MAG: tRNA (adenosine(37)-N6)-threonylcarbamoyltransferase complex dimerization subunit type 1 TsaB [Candidatus Izemoplasmataceae bacterium]